MHPRLPPELFESIVCHVTSKSDLYQLLFVSNLTHHEAKRFLYRNITVNDDIISTTLEDALHKPPLARLVRRLEVTIKQDTRNSVDTSCLISLHAILRDLVSLEHFVIQGDLSFDASGGETAFLLQHATTSLKSLVFDWIAQEHIALLEKQSQLKQLIMHQRPTTWNIAAFPHLRIVGCPAELAGECFQDIVSYNILRLRWTQGVPGDEWPSFHSIRFLDLFLYNIDLHVFWRIVCKFPNLDYLKCTIWPKGFLQRVKEERLKRISSLSLASLCKVYLHVMAVGEEENWDHQPLFACIPSLAVVQLQFGNDSMSRYWLRQDPSRWSLVPSQPDEWKWFDASQPIGLDEAQRRETLPYQDSPRW